MTARFTLGVALATVAAGVGSYWATVSFGQRPSAARATASAGRGLAGWLGLSREQQRRVEAADPTFPDDSSRLRAELDAARESLARLLATDSASDEEIRRAVEKTIDVHTRLERRATQHLLRVRSILTPEQRRRLLDVSAEHVRQGRGYGYGGPPGGGGRGQGGGRGPGGKGPPWREDNSQR